MTGCKLFCQTEASAPSVGGQGGGEVAYWRRKDKFQDPLKIISSAYFLSNWKILFCRLISRNSRWRWHAYMVFTISIWLDTYICIYDRRGIQGRTGMCCVSNNPRRRRGGIQERGLARYMMRVATRLATLPCISIPFPEPEITMLTKLVEIGMIWHWSLTDVNETHRRTL